MGRYAPHLLDTDQVALAVGFSLQNNTLYDDWLCIPHRLGQDGLHLLAGMQPGIRVHELYGLAHHRGVPDDQLYAFLGLLNYIGALRRKRSFTQKLAAIVARCKAATMGVHFASLRYRNVFATRTFLLAISKSAWPVALASTFVCALFIAAGLSSYQTSLLYLLGSVALYIATLIVHELAHVVLIQRHQHQPVLLSSELRLGILHPELPWRSEVFSALSGPLSGALLASLVAYLSLPASPLFGCICVAVAAIHMLALLPLYGDGASLKRSMTNKHE